MLRNQQIETTLFLDRRAVSGYLGFAVVCALAAVISLPPARSVATFGSFSLLWNEPLYFHVFLITLALLAVRDGLVGADRGQMGWRGDAAQMARGGVAVLLVLPFAVLQLGLHPGRVGAMSLFLLLALLVWWAVGSTTRWLVRMAGRGWARAAAVAWIAGYWCLPLLAGRSLAISPIRVAEAWFGVVGFAGSGSGPSASLSWSAALVALGLPIVWGGGILAFLHRRS